MVSKKGIITLTLVISHELAKPTVRRGFSFMFTLFKVKTKLQYQLEEYIEWKSRFSIISAKQHKEVLLDFIKRFNYKDIQEVTLDIIKQFRKEMLQKTTNFTTQKAMQALRCFLRYHKKQVDFNPEIIGDEGIIDLPNVDQSAKIIPMIKEKKLGRPVKNTELIRTVKRLKDIEKLTYRKIAMVVDRDVSYVYRMYHFDL